MAYSVTLEVFSGTSAVPSAPNTPPAATPITSVGPISPAERDAWESDFLTLAFEVVVP